MAIELTRVATSTRAALLRIGLVMALGACSGGAAAGPSAAPTTTVAASGVASPSPISGARSLDEGPQGPLDPGTYVTGSPFLTRVTFAMPAKWFADIGGPYAVFLDPGMDPVSND